MPYLYSSEQEQIRDEVRRVMAASCAPATLRNLLESKGACDGQFWGRAAEMGWTAIGIAEADGGLGMSIVDTLIIAEEAGRALAGAPFLATAFAAQHALAGAGGHQDLLGAMAAGETKLALAFEEAGEPLPQAPSVMYRDGRLSGSKQASLGAAAADVAIVLASQDGAPCLALVSLDAVGVSREAIDSIDNSRCSANLHFDNAPATLLAHDDPMVLAGECLGRLALHLAAEAIGGSEACIAKASDYANQRQAFGQAIGKFQAVKHAIAEIYVANELTRASVLEAAVRLERGDRHTGAYIAAARLNAVHGYDYAAATATQVHGGIGVTWEEDMHLHYRRARSLALEAGPPWFWEDCIIAMLEAA
jgi:alkylation response protein AidB-like acyl-CoA dehydrogenase